MIIKDLKHTINLRRLVMAALLCTAVASPVFGQHSSHSMLKSGNWWKMEIPSDGIYRIGADAIASLSGCAINDIALYGHSGGPLDITNGQERPDDLEEIAIEVHDMNGDGLFNGSDYIIFYGEGANRWSYDNYTNQYVHTTHPFSKSNYIYVTNSSGSHKRIGTAESGTVDGITTISTYRHTALHESELVNTHSTGQIWVGERFSGSNTTQSFSFSLPAAPVGVFNVRYALASVSTAYSRFTATLNGTSFSHTFNKSNKYDVFSDQFPSGNSSTLTFSIEYQYSENLAIGYLDYIELDAELPIVWNGSTLQIRIPADDGKTHIHSMANGNQNVRIWDVTDFNSVTERATACNSGVLTYNAKNDKNRTYIAFDGSSYKSPASIVRVANQDLHGHTNPDMVIVSHPNYLDEANRLASLHSINDNMEVLVTTQEQIFNEFSSGQTDPTAIREMLRMYYLRSQNSGGTYPRYLLLFGKGSFDNKDLLGLGQTTVVTYETPRSFDDDGLSYCTDDFFGYLDDGEQGTSFENLEVAIGRLPAKSTDEASIMVDKIERYMLRSDLSDSTIRGDWRNSIALLADDADPSSPGDTSFTWSQEMTARQIAALYPQYTFDKLYADAYIQQSGADGSFYPDLNNALKKRMDYGCLLLNYIGHGSIQYIGTERFMMKRDIAAYANHHQLTCFITSTCSFGRFDKTDEICGAEEFLLADGGGIACVAASRPISHIQVVNTDMCLQVLNPANTIGDGIRIAKNNRPTAACIALLGDPALRLSLPTLKTVVTSINGTATDNLHSDSAMVLSTVYVEGEIQDSEGNLMDDFDGVIYPEVYDRPTSALTLANDNEGCEVHFTQQNSLLYKGRTSVNGGRFSYHFIVPRDVAYQYGQAKICHYAKSASEDATGAYTNIYFGGFDENVEMDNSRPSIEIFLNDTNFRNGGITDENPTMLVRLYDSLGINAVGSGLGHDITAVLDGNVNNTIVLNDLYETDIYDEHSGTITYSFTSLAKGRHTLAVKAWNIYNYSNSAELVFYVLSSDTAEATAFSAYPNPASGETWLRMEHNCPDKIVSATFEIYDIRGRIIRTLEAGDCSGSYVAGPVRWDCSNSSGSVVLPGVYVARCTMTTSNGERLTGHGKIIVGK